MARPRAHRWWFERVVLKRVLPLPGATRRCRGQSVAATPAPSQMRRTLVDTVDGARQKRRSYAQMCAGKPAPQRTPP